LKYVTWQGIDYEFSEEGTTVSKHERV